jgi:hypothetical protein
VIQIILNYLSFGCAGFAALSPYRVELATLSFLTWLSGKRSTQSLGLLILLTFSPEITDLINRNAPNAEHICTYEYIVEGMKCQACALGLKTRMKSAGFDAVRVVFNSKTVTFSTTRPPAAVESLISSVLGDLGYSKYNLQEMKCE